MHQLNLLPDTDNLSARERLRGHIHLNVPAEERDELLADLAGLSDDECLLSLEAMLRFVAGGQFMAELAGEAAGGAA